MKIKIYCAALFLLSLILRLYSLSSLPNGFHVDEVKVGWNAYSLLKTGRDDWDHAFPLYYDSFGDYRPAGILYATTIPTFLFGMTESSTRLTPAIFGALLTIITIVFTYTITKNKYISLLAGVFSAISPWQISVSRATSEGVIALTLVLAGLTIYIKSLQTKFTLISWSTSVILFITSYGFYHSPRLLVPVFLLAILAYFKSRNKAAIALCLCLGVITVGLTQTKAARARLGQVSISSDQTVNEELLRLPFEEGHNSALLARSLHNKIVIYGTKAISEYTTYIGSKFLIAAFEAKPTRYATVSVGIVTIVEYLCIIIGLIALAKYKRYRLFLLLLLLAPLPATLTLEDSPNMHRAMFMTPFFTGIAAIGLHFIRRQQRHIYTIVLAGLLLNTAYYWHMYRIHNPVRAQIGITRNVGAKEVVLALQKYSSRKILLPNAPDSLYPWYAFFNHLNPQDFNHCSQPHQDSWSYHAVTFTSLHCPSYSLSANDTSDVIAVDAEGCDSTKSEKLGLHKIEIITRPNNSGDVYTMWSH